MRASRTDDSRRVDWSKVKDASLEQMARQVARYVRGIRGERAEGVTRKQIRAWFYGTPPAYLEEGLNMAIARDLIACFSKSPTSSRRANGAYSYVSRQKESERDRVQE